MTPLAFSDRFFDDMEDVELESKQDEIMDAIDLLSTVPEMGSRRLPISIEREFGEGVRKLVVRPFLVVYELMEEEGLVFVHGLVHQRRAQ